ncbi:3-Deoxy-D-manno-octulosonic-acid transferase (kdotransferase) [Candidatus Electrothrix aarhusensis]|uniref:3-deoxy-D-manno-octulosonic acid transferase n=1 Tax=Candidatus Electrothrix aarhusensis TaxID=1859131 RepID=A0A3S3UC36_9BACT|nr:3-Deoxy-D-manno-octulosonic-acid transferase (kdotransferase) [Candidatus Electrothrix aarhusensis]
MLYNFYRITGAAFYPLLVMASPLLERLLPNWQLSQRFGHYPDIDQSAASKPPQLIWIHAASVGEVQAARALLRFWLIPYLMLKFF